LDSPRDLRKGQKLVLTLGTPSDYSLEKLARRVLVRLLKAGESPSEKVGVIAPTGIDVPKSRVIEITIPADYAAVTQISVHGGHHACDQFLGENNGPATLTSVELQE
jgi:hypothetical protein